MLTLVDARSNKSASRDPRLMSDYLAFDRQRQSRRQYMKAFGGMAIIVALGAMFERVPVNEAWIVGGLLMLPPLVLAMLEAVHRRRLVRRLDRVRAEVQSGRKS